MKAPQRESELRPDQPTVETEQSLVMIDSRQGQHGLTACSVILTESQLASLLGALNSPVIKGALKVNLPTSLRSIFR